MNIYIRTRTYTNTYTIYTYTYMYVHMHICLWVCTYASIHVCVCMRACIYIYVSCDYYLYICVCIFTIFARYATAVYKFLHAHIVYARQHLVCDSKFVARLLIKQDEHINHEGACTFFCWSFSVTRVFGQNSSFQLSKPLSLSRALSPTLYNHLCVVSLPPSTLSSTISLPPPA